MKVFLILSETGRIGKTFLHWDRFAETIETVAEISRLCYIDSQEQICKCGRVSV